MIWSWVKRCGIEPHHINRLGFVAHGRIISDRPIWNKPPGYLPDLRAALADSGYPHIFTVEASNETIASTLHMLVNLKEVGGSFDLWTAFLVRLHDPLPHYEVFFAFANEANAIKARLSLE
jgi:hypothetical protein